MKLSELKNLIRESIQEVLTTEPDGPIGTEVEVYNGRRYYLPLFLDMFHPETHRRVGHIEFSSVKQAKNYFDKIISNDVTNQYPIKIVDRKEDILFQHVPKNIPTQGDVNPSESLHELSEEDPLYVEYHSQRQGEKPFMMGDTKYEYVNAKYPNGKIDIGVYSYAGDIVYSYNAFRKRMGIK